MNASTLRIAVIAAALPAHVLLILGSAAAGLALLVYIGIALPAVWSARPARRKAAATILSQILDTCTAQTGGKGRPGGANSRSTAPAADSQRGSTPMNLKVTAPSWLTFMRGRPQ
jgi:hypothetical protein